MKTKINRANIVYLAIPLLSFLILFYGCSVKLISEYDEVIDRSATELHIKIETFLRGMETAAGTGKGEYVNNSAFYQEAIVALSSLRLRAEAIPENERTVQHINEIEKNIENLRRLHEQRGQAGLTGAFINPLRTIFYTQFKALLTLELAKKRDR